MKNSLLRRVLALVGLSAASAGPSNVPPPKPPKPRYHNQPPPPPMAKPIEDLFYLPAVARGWNCSPPSNQRKVRKARRQAHANGKKHAFR